MSKHDKNILFVLESADEQPLSKRIEVYRWVAELAGNAETTKRINGLADQLEAAQNLCREFEFVLAHPQNHNGKQS